MTPEQIAELRRVVNGLVVAHAGQLMQVLEGLRAANDPDLARETIGQHLTAFVDLAADYTANWYDELDEGLGFAVDSKHDVPDQRIDKTVRWALFAPGEESSDQRLLSSAQRMIYDGSRTTVIGNAEREGALWFRHARDTACRFCRVMTVNPAAHTSPNSKMPSHDDDCQCLAVPARPGHRYSHPGYVRDWVAEYRQANTGDLRSTIGRMDRNSV